MLKEVFLQNFVKSKKLERNMEELFNAHQGANESIWDYLARLGNAKLLITLSNEYLAMTAFDSGLNKGACKNDKYWVGLHNPAQAIDLLTRHIGVKEFKKVSRNWAL